MTFESLMAQSVLAPSDLPLLSCQHARNQSYLCHDQLHSRKHFLQSFVDIRVQYNKTKHSYHPVGMQGNIFHS